MFCSQGFSQDIADLLHQWGPAEDPDGWRCHTYHSHTCHCSECLRLKGPSSYPRHSKELSVSDTIEIWSLICFLRWKVSKCIKTHHYKQNIPTNYCLNLLSSAKSGGGSRAGWPKWLSVDQNEGHAPENAHPEAHPFQRCPGCGPFPPIRWLLPRHPQYVRLYLGSMICHR